MWQKNIGKWIRDASLLGLNIFLIIQIWINRIENFKLSMLFKNFNVAKGTKCILYSTFWVTAFSVLTYLWIKETKENMKYSKIEDYVVTLIRGIIWLVLLAIFIICVKKSLVFLGLMGTFTIVIYLLLKG